MFRHLHIVACSPRSGTTLLHEVMVTCFNIDKHYEHELRFNLVSGQGGQIVLTKRPKDTMYMPRVIDSVPQTYVIYMVRDPRDVIVSRHGKDKSKYYANIRLWRQMHGYARSMYESSHFLEIRYEDFVREPDSVQQKISQKFPWLETRHPFSAYHEYAVVSDKSKTAMHGVRPIAPTSVGLWKNNLPRIKGQQERHGSLTPALIECGYETSADWEAMLDGVTADHERSYYAETLYPWNKASQYLDALRKVAAYRRRRSSG